MYTCVCSDGSRKRRRSGPSIGPTFVANPASIMRADTHTGFEERRGGCFMIYRAGVYFSIGTTLGPFCQYRVSNFELVIGLLIF